MTIRPQSCRSAEAEEIRSYILAMVVELADMADKANQSQLADNLRYVAWPQETQALFSSSVGTVT